MKISRYRRDGAYSYTLGATLTFELLKMRSELVRRVFFSPDWSRHTVIKEISPFLTTRISSLVAETIILEITVGLLHWNEPLMKILANVVVLIMNYIGSKLFVFRDQEAKKK